MAYSKQVLFRRPNAILFDWDDTLSHHHDVSAGLMDDIYASTHKSGGAPVTGKQILKEWYESPERCCMRYFPGYKVSDIQGMYRQRLDALPLDDTTLLPHARELLEALKTKNITMAIVSNKSLERLEQELDYLGVRDYFKVVIGFDGADRETIKPNPEHILKAVKALKIPFDNLWFVGDSPEDASAARSDSIQRFHVGTFLKDIVHTRVENNDPHGRLLFVNNLEEFKTLYVDPLPEKEVITAQGVFL